jgi:hypothetical protein
MAEVRLFPLYFCLVAPVRFSLVFSEEPPYPFEHKIVLAWANGFVG